MSERILLCKPRLTGREIHFVEEAFKDDWIVPLGPDVTAFEQELKDFLGSKGEVVALSSGTAAMHLAMVDLGIEPTDEVICQTMTFCASCNPVVYTGGQPVFVDSDPLTWNLDPCLLRLAIEQRIEATGRTPKAIIPVHLYGMPAQMDAIMAVATDYGITVVEDAAEALGSSYHGQRCGILGRYGVLSFNGNKMITTSGGGALICPDAEAKRRVLFYATQAREQRPYYQHQQIGYNYRMSNISAAIGRGQLTGVNQYLAHHRMLAAIYAEEFAGCQAVIFHANPNAAVYDSNYWLSTILIDPRANVHGQASTAEPGSPNPNVEALRLILDRAGVESRPLWKPMHMQPVYAQAPAVTNGVAENLFSRGLCLPSGPHVMPDHARMIASLIKQSIG